MQSSPGNTITANGAQRCYVSSGCRFWKGIYTRDLSWLFDASSPPPLVVLVPVWKQSSRCCAAQSFCSGTSSVFLWFWREWNHKVVKFLNAASSADLLATIPLLVFAQPEPSHCCREVRLWHCDVVVVWAKNIGGHLMRLLWILGVFSLGFFGGCFLLNRLLSSS